MESYPTGSSGSGFPAIDTQQKGASGGCGVRLLALKIGLGVMRCVHTVSEDGSFPTAEEMTSDADNTYNDLGLLLDVITCEVPSMSGAMSVKVDRWTPQGAQGGCVGGEWGFYVAFDPCLCAPLPTEG